MRADERHHDTHDANVAMSLSLLLDAFDAAEETGPPIRYRPARHESRRAFRLAGPLPPLRGLLSVLSFRAQQSDLSPAALRRHRAGARRPGRGRVERRSAVAAGGAARRLRLRVGRSLLLRAQPPC